MSLNNIRLTVLEIINEIRRKMSINTVTTLSADKYSLILLQFLNEIITECSDFDDWPELYDEINVPVSAGVKTYSLNVTFPIQSIYEIAFDTDAAALEYRDIVDIRVLGRSGTSNGTPRQFAIKGTDTRGNPEFTVHPTPTTAHQASAKVFDVAVYKKIELFTTNDLSKRPQFPANLLIQGLYAYALLDENSGAGTDATESAFALYYKLMREANNRYTSDTGHDVFFTPTSFRR